MHAEKLIINAELLDSILGFASSYPSLEWGGMLVGHREGFVAHAVAAVFPAQKRQEMCFCEFDGLELVLVKNAINVTNESSTKKWATVAWVHTHPNLGIFLSGTDKRTFETWSALDPLAVAVVVDPFAKFEQVLACDCDLNGIPYELASELSVDELQSIFIFTEEVASVYFAKGLEVPTTIIPMASDRQMIVEIGLPREFTIR